MSDLNRSDSYYRKICLEIQGIVPRQTEIKNRLGDNLTKVFFDSCLPALKPYLGLSPTLEGPGDDLWVSPSDLLIGKVRLKPPLTSKHIRALTHQGILEIGNVVEEKFKKEYEEEKQRALKENEELLRYICKKEKRDAMQRVREEEKRIQEEIVTDLKLDFQETLRRELNKLEQRLVVEKDQAVEETKMEVEKLMQLKLEMAVLETVQRLTEVFATELVKQSKCLHEHFWYHIKEEKEKLKKTIFNERSQCKDTLDKLRIEMQCENIANVMYVLAKERRRCACEKQDLKQNFLARLGELEKELEERGEKLQETVEQLEKAGQEIRAREASLFEIIKQFQKFIYFVLRAVPTQAEYLLNIEKIMIFELTKTVIATKPEFFQSEKGETKTSTVDSIRSGSESGEGRTGLVAKDFHDCENYIKYIPSAKTLATEEDLPAFTYDENLYVREDFRNMISQGLNICRSNALWTFSTGDVVEILKPASSEHTSLQCSVAFAKKDDGSGPRKSILSDREHNKSFVSVRFSKGFDIVLATEEKILQSHSYNDVADAAVERTPSEESSGSRDSFLLLLPSHSYNDVVDAAVDRTPSDASRDSKDESSTDEPVSLHTNKSFSRSRLELARDSLTLLKEKKGLSNSSILKKDVPRTSEGSKTSKTSKKSVTKTNSLLLAAKRSVDSKISGTKELLARGKDSRLDLHVDSLILLKSKDTIRPVSSSAPVCEHTKTEDFVKKRHYVNIGIQVEPPPKSVQLSHIEVIPSEEEHRMKASSVYFHSRPKIIPSEDVSDTVLSCYIKQPHPPKPSVEEVYSRTSEVKVLGDPDSTAHLESQDEFTAKRVTSFIRIFREQPSLQRLFTEVFNK